MATKTKKVSKRTRTRIVNLIKAGKVQFASHIDFKEVGKPETAEERKRKFEKPEFTHVSFSHGWRKWRKKGFEGDNGGCTILWGAKGIGGGELTIKLNKLGELYLDTERMGKDFTKKILCALVDSGMTDCQGNS